MDKLPISVGRPGALRPFTQRAALGAGLRVGSILVGMALLLAACSAGPAASNVLTLNIPSATANPSALPSAPLDPQDALQAYAKCMRDHGVDIQVASAGAGVTTGGGVVVSGNAGPAGSGKPAGGGQAPQANGQRTTPEQVQQAQQACQSLMPKPAALDPNATPDPKLVEQLLAFSKCMRDHGVDYPDPQFQSGGGVTMQLGGPGSSVDPSSTKFQDAQKACSASLPGGGPLTIDGKSGAGGSITSGTGGTVPAP